MVVSVSLQLLPECKQIGLTYKVLFIADLVSKGFPPEAVISLEKKVPEPHSRFSFSFECKIFTFVLFRAFNITLEFGAKEMKNFHVHSDPNPHEELEQAGVYSISGAIKSDYGVSSVWINISSDRLTSVTCSAKLTHNSSWVSVRATVNVLADDLKSQSDSLGSITAFAILGTWAILSIMAASLFFWRYRKQEVKTVPFPLIVVVWNEAVRSRLKQFFIFLNSRAQGGC